MATIASTDIEISTYQRLHPRAYLTKFIAENLRPDGRELAEFRLLEINSGYCQAPKITVERSTDSILFHFFFHRINHHRGWVRSCETWRDDSCVWSQS